MARDTGRDRTWNIALTWALDGEQMHAEEVAHAAEVSERTAADTLRTMAAQGWLTSKGGWGPNRAYYVAGERLPKNLTAYS